MADNKISTLILKVDLSCPKCYNKIRKVLCQFRCKIVSQTFDMKNNLVIISGFFDPNCFSKKLCCKAGKVIKSIEIVKDKPPPPPPPVVVKPPPPPVELPPVVVKPPPPPVELPPVVVKPPPPPPVELPPVVVKPPPPPVELPPVVVPPPVELPPPVVVKPPPPPKDDPPPPVTCYPAPPSYEWCDWWWRPGTMPCHCGCGGRVEPCYCGCGGVREPCYCGCGGVREPCGGGRGRRVAAEPMVLYCLCGRPLPCYCGCGGGGARYCYDETPSGCSIM